MPVFEWLDSTTQVLQTRHLGEMPDGTLPSWCSIDGDALLVPSQLQPAWLAKALKPSLVAAAKREKVPGARVRRVYLPFAWTLRRSELQAAQRRIADLTINDKKTRDATLTALAESADADVLEPLPKTLRRRLRPVDAAFLVALGRLLQSDAPTVRFEDDYLVNALAPRPAAAFVLPRKQRSNYVQDLYERNMEGLVRQLERDPQDAVAAWGRVAATCNDMRDEAMAATAYRTSAKLWQTLGEEAQSDADARWAAHLAEPG